MQFSYAATILLLAPAVLAAAIDQSNNNAEEKRTPELPVLELEKRQVSGLVIWGISKARTDSSCRR